MKIQFRPNYKKSLEAVLYVINRVPDIHVYNLVKVMFQADWLSVNTYGAPVTGDTYLALSYGTVPDMIYNEMIQGRDPLLLDALDLKTLPLYRHDNTMYALRPYETKHLSETDLECLEQGIEAYAALSFEEAKQKNHAVKAWSKAREFWPNGPIDWYDLIEDPEIREELEGVAQCVVV